MDIGLFMQKTNVYAQKIDSSLLRIYRMVIVAFFVYNKLEKVWFFEKSFLLANTNIKVILRMPFLLPSNANIDFETRDFTWKKYSAIKVLLITRRVQLIGQQKFVKVAINENLKTFVVYIAGLKVAMFIDLFKASQIAKL